MSAAFIQGYGGRRLAYEMREHPSGKAVIFAHGFTSDRSWRGRFDYIAQCLFRRGYGTLQFDFGGLGESDDAPLRVPHEIEDLSRVVAYARDTMGNRLALWGHSLGSRICLQANPDGISTMILTGAGTGPARYDWDAYFDPEQMKQLHEEGCIHLPVRGRSRSMVEVPAQMLADFEDVDQAAMLSAVRVPVLIVHGDADDEEQMLHAITLRGMRWLDPLSKLRVISGATHDFLGHVDTLVCHGAEWLDRHL